MSVLSVLGKKITGVNCATGTTSNWHGASLLGGAESNRKQTGTRNSLVGKYTCSLLLSTLSLWCPLLSDPNSDPAGKRSSFAQSQPQNHKKRRIEGRLKVKR